MNIPDSSNRLQASTEPAPSKPADVAARQPKAVEQAAQVAVQQQQAPRKVEAPERPVYSRAPEVAEFVAHLREVSEIRSDVISAVRKLLAAGQYDTREAAEEAAKRLLGQE